MDKNLRNSGDYFVSLAPHIRSNDTVQRIMLDVLIALVPAAIASVYFFGLYSLAIMAVSVGACVLSEYVFQKLMKKPIQVKDLSAVVTGILLAFNVPAGAPLWMVAFGGVFAIIIVKECFGGIGGNFMNPALAARVMLMASWPQQMTAYVQPDGMTGATPLQILKEGGGNLPSLMDMLTGNIGGVIGETCAIALILGGIYLLVRKVIDWKTPVIYIVSTAIFLLLFGVKVDLLAYEVLGGGLLLGAIFMATDYSSSPMNAKGKIIFALGAGLITAVIRAKGGMPEGVSYSILLMNVCTPLIDKFTVGEAYGPKKA
ncbi:electron transport complex, RnfABCDGE type, D subunit [Peptoniphilus sp. oral taxon 375 str. F0436]|uniref:RnfABCDGE type electron transport complex subunit D n=1 Tax=Urinicoccus timonensis TaxID=2024205 RepID=UPI00021A19F0|nr:RnfABCDGE type electron transport complex subunit D [Urinicoccus timonensis]EGS29831.1 electron transport complex, RnfABCDGE type, D subunit [Peptoniphilus sp. oral taxon 375 str. F0436]